MKESQPTFVACSADVRNGLANAFRISEEKGALSYYTFSVLHSKIAAQLAAQPLNIQDEYLFWDFATPDTQIH